MRSFDDIPIIKPGDNIRAPYLNQLREGIVRVMACGGFTSSKIHACPPETGKGVRVIPVALIEPVLAASFDPDAVELDDWTFTAPIAYRKANNKWTFDWDLGDTTIGGAGPSLEVINIFGTVVEISSGKWRVGLTIGGFLFNVDCAEFDLPTDVSA